MGVNKRIKEFAEQAGFMDSRFSESGDDCERELKKFAELIVKECAEIANDGIDPAESYLIGNDILEHFGVEE
jgi:hypothetical protein